MQARFSKNDQAIFNHAEIDALHKALKVLNIDELSRSSMYICRMKFLDMHRKEISFGLAKPCSGCERALRNYSIKEVIYTTETGIAYLW